MATEIDYPTFYEESGSKEAVKGITGFIQVTKRNPEQVLLNISLTEGMEYSEKNIDNLLKTLPQGARVADLGSGTYQEIARFIKKARPDITVFSLDPTLAIDENRITSGEVLVFHNHGKGLGLTPRERVVYVTPNYLEPGDGGIDDYQINVPMAMFTGRERIRKSLLHSFGRQLRAEEALALHRRRLRSAAKFGGLPFIYPAIPDQIRNLDWIIEFQGPCYYVPADDKSRLAYLREIISRLKPGGKADILPWESEFLDTDSDGSIYGATEYCEEFYKTLGEVDARVEVMFSHAAAGAVRPELHIVHH